MENSDEVKLNEVAGNEPDCRCQSHANHPHKVPLGVAAAHPGASEMVAPDESMAKAAYADLEAGYIAIVLGTIAWIQPFGILADPVQQYIL